VRKRKVTYPVARTANRPPRVVGDPNYVRPTVVTIDTSAMSPRGSFAIGDRVVIASDGLYAGETAIVERLAQGVIPAAVVRTEAGRTRRVRVIDLRPASGPAPAEA
jgi:hypothetical protein